MDDFSAASARANSGNALSVGHSAGRVDKGSARGLTAQFEIVQRSTQFEQGGALAAGKFAGGGDVGGAGGGVGVGVGAQLQQFGVVETDPGIAGELQCGVQAVALFAQYLLLLGEVEQKVIGCF